jgi:hypothetical protein
MVHKCAHCDYTSEKSFNVKRHTIRCHNSVNNHESQNVVNAAAFVSQPTAFVAQPAAFVAQTTAFVAQPAAFVAQPAGSVTLLENQCSQCLRVFSRKYGLIKHAVNCTGCPSLQCEICGMTFLNRSIKYRHKKKGTCTPNSEHSTPQVINNITNNTTNNIHNDHSKHLHINYISFNTPNNDPIQFNTDHMDDPAKLKPIFAHPEFLTMFGSFTNEVFKAPENQIVHKNNMSRNYAQVYIKEQGEWDYQLDNQIYHKMARGVSTSALMLSEKHQRKAPLSREHREQLRDIAIDCECSPSETYGDEDLQYSRQTRDAIKYIKMKTHQQSVGREI